MIGFQPLGPRRPNFFRIVFANAWSTTTQMVDELLERMDAYGNEAVAAAAAAAAAAAPAPAEKPGARSGTVPVVAASGASAAAAVNGAGRRGSKAAAEVATGGVAAV
jgi:hypothetical protein